MANNNGVILAEKNEDSQLPIPSAWRPLFAKIAESFANRDYRLTSMIHGVSTISEDTQKQIREYIDDYGEELTELPEETWDSSVCIWMGTHWDALIDLWTIGEGRSDLVLHAQVFETPGGFSINVESIYVP